MHHINMMLRVVLVIFTLQSLKCMGEQTFLSEIDNEMLELHDLTLSTVNFLSQKPREKPKNTLYDQKSEVTSLVYEGPSGEWDYWVYTEGNHAACGVFVQWEDAQDTYTIFNIVKGEKDDSAMNGFRFVSCNWNNWNDQKTFDVVRGPEGHWLDDYPVMCKAGTYIYGIELQINEYVGKGYDDTSVNGINILCSDKKGGSFNQNWYKGWWGSWQSIKTYDPLLKVVGANGKRMPDNIGDQTNFWDNHTDNEGLTGLKLLTARFP